MKTAIIGCLACAVLAFASVLSAQSPKEDVISSTTEIVTVPVVVTDSSGKAVRGIKKEDFQIRENGKEQRIASFEEVTATRLTIHGNPQQNGIYTNRLSNETPVALGILVIDFVNTRTVSQAWALRGAISFLDRWKGEGGFQQPIMVAAITRQGLRIIHQATSSPEVLEAALQIIKPASSPTSDNRQGIEMNPAVNPPRGPDNSPLVLRQRGETDADYSERLKDANREAETIDQMERSDEVIRAAAVDADTKTTMWALMTLANGVAGIPGRKAMIWCSEVFPFKAPQDVFQSPQWVNKHGSTDEDPELKPLRETALLALNRAAISVYPVNAAGLLSPGFFNASSAGRMMTGAQWSAKSLGSIEGDMDTRAGARMIAEETAGSACMSTNDIGDCLNRALQDASHYYMLSYYPDPKPKGNGYRKIKVELKGEKLNVRARDSYWHGIASTHGLSSKSELAVALGSNLDYTALPIILKFTGLKPGPGGKRIAEFVVGVDGRALSIDEEHNNHISLLIGAQAKADDNPTLISIDTKLKPELVPQIRAKQLTHTGGMELAPGKYDVRLVVRDNLNGRIGSVVAPIEVQ